MLSFLLRRVDVVERSLWIRMMEQAPVPVEAPTTMDSKNVDDPNSPKGARFYCWCGGGLGVGTVRMDGG